MGVIPILQTRKPRPKRLPGPRAVGGRAGTPAPSPGTRSGTHSRIHRLGVPARRSPLCPVEPWGVPCGHGRGRLAERRRGQPCPQGAGTCSSCVPGWVGLCSIKNGQGEETLRPPFYVQKLWSLPFSVRSSVFCSDLKGIICTRCTASGAPSSQTPAALISLAGGMEGLLLSFSWVDFCAS